MKKVIERQFNPNNIMSMIILMKEVDFEGPPQLQDL